MRIGYNTGYDPGGGAFVTEQERFMKEAVRQAKKARALMEVPIGCVID